MRDRARAAELRGDTVRAAELRDLLPGLRAGAADAGPTGDTPAIEPRLAERESFAAWATSKDAERAAESEVAERLHAEVWEKSQAAALAHFPTEAEFRRRVHSRGAEERRLAIADPHAGAELLRHLLRDPDAATQAAAFAAMRRAPRAFAAELTLSAVDLRSLRITVATPADEVEAWETSLLGLSYGGA